MAKTETMEKTAMVKSGYAALANNDLMAELAEEVWKDSNVCKLSKSINRADRI